MEKPSNGTLLIVTSPYFAAGLLYKERAAPIIRYMAKWDYDRIKAHCTKRGWSIKTIEELEKHREENGV